MVHRIIEARHVRGHVLHIKFEDGIEGDIDLEGELEGPVFQPLQDVERFKRFTLHPELATVTWENGADLAPEFLREKVLTFVAREKKGPYNPT